MMYHLYKLFLQLSNNIISVYSSYEMKGGGGVNRPGGEGATGK